MKIYKRKRYLLSKYFCKSSLNIKHTKNVNERILVMKNNTHVTTVVSCEKLNIYNASLTIMNNLFAWSMS